MAFETAALHKSAPPLELGLVTDDVEMAYTRALNAGATAVKKPEKKPWGQSVGYVRDNNGFLVEICSPVYPSEGDETKSVKSQSDALMSPENLWARYAATWSNVDADDRLAELNACLVDDITYCDLNGLIKGRAALSVYMEGYQQQVLTGSHFNIRSIVHHHDRTLAQWIFWVPTAARSTQGQVLAL